MFNSPGVRRGLTPLLHSLQVDLRDVVGMHVVGVDGLVAGGGGVEVVDEVVLEAGDVDHDLLGAVGDLFREDELLGQVGLVQLQLHLEGRRVPLLQRQVRVLQHLQQPARRRRRSVLRAPVFRERVDLSRRLVHAEWVELTLRRVQTLYQLIFEEEQGGVGGEQPPGPFYLLRRYEHIPASRYRHFYCYPISASFVHNGSIFKSWRYFLDFLHNQQVSRVQFRHKFLDVRSAFVESSYQVDRGDVVVVVERVRQHIVGDVGRAGLGTHWGLAHTGHLLEDPRALDLHYRGEALDVLVPELLRHQILVDSHGEGADLLRVWR